MMKQRVIRISGAVSCIAAFGLSGCLGTSQAQIKQQRDLVKQCAVETGAHGSFRHNAPDSQGRFSVVAAKGTPPASATVINTCLRSKQAVSGTGKPGVFDDSSPITAGVRDCPVSGLVGAGSYCVNGKVVTY
ncbi:hypothetical protein SAMN04488030_0424 [Aliiroseovarius halocynthiae]|uniref:hypothetical protein n=1 Tax=Aliiroseovarius halocynthiae TaxID=985055 RepID=UPI001C8F6C4C|nr:hypothetical protein [Aliiroseovarius halocynthiae]SMR70811.1 hypothetical protein SAMN04488030_0424 [Aliiroseovarius halocynthiae]